MSLPASLPPIAPRLALSPALRLSLSPSSALRLRLIALLLLAALTTLVARAQLALTPSTTEGPYYPFNSSQRLDTTALVNADNDLTQVGTSTTRASGTRLILSGTLVNTAGAAIAGAKIELWEADNNGVYYHSADSTYARRDANFQSYGTTTTDTAGAWSFRTIKPGLYTGRIRHFHFMVRLNGTAVLTSQFMFEEDRATFSGDNVAQPLVAAGTIDRTVLVTTTGTDALDGATALFASKQIVINAAATGSTAAAPVITAQPAAAAVTVGDTVTLAVTATSTAALAYQWRRDGTALAGATTATLTLPAITAAQAGSYTVVVSNSAGSITSNAALVTVSAASPASASSIVNLSVRSYLPSANSSLTAGFVIQSASGKRILVRAVGPTLGTFGVANALADPRVEVYDASAAKLAENDSWDSSLATTFASLGAFALPAGSKDAALTVTLPAGAGTAVVRGTEAGIVLVEAYDTASLAASKLVNLSARASVGAADSVLIAGFSLNGTGSKRLLIRAVGPRLADLGVGGVLANPKLELFSATGTVLAANDDWPAALAATFTTAGAFSLTNGSKDAAVVVTLPAPGSYTVAVSGVDGATGEALVELYDLP